MGTITVDEATLRALLKDLAVDVDKGASVDDLVFELKREPEQQAKAPDENLYWYEAFIVSVYDGDTVRADWDLGSNLLSTNEPFRLWGINAPEVRGETKEAGYVVRDYLRELILDKKVIINTLKDKKGKYGRYLAIIYLQQEDGTWLNVNDHLMEKFEGVVPYLR